ncbi:chemotaxis protein CheB [Nocardia terpenica]|uniref:protein-glutamate methylesterase n=1 Tax=Nocardia terpenica TaxID=455432 RepID=A0A164M2K0_9NOCA|nr:chemotaxis protein CheB [Nocardia terpenica]KZM72970.1 chemotaxis protein [Nocardia terpenica]MBF6061089.1 chemotaxis protein CheB [Nocardia terpenica]MBF6105682.1 chemotaxis protein CheB [Nocardia terpenica]MBF6112848.1 chemotaxis protein CheB [Nocardia terpenica]MBF6118978.1 chemotaxis protein CheB [Nocardia terpenica]
MKNSRRGPSAAGYGIVAIGSSAGGVGALIRLLSGLPMLLPVPVVVVQHLNRQHDTIIAEVLNRKSALPVALAEAGMRIAPGAVYIAPPNFHLLVGRGGMLMLSSGALVQFVRPSADLLFCSIAEAYAHHAIACVLTGSGSDGARGVDAVKARGGTVIVQDPDEAEFRGMPDAAVRTGAADLILPLAEIADAIGGLVEEREP